MSNILAKFKDVKCFVFDVDGVFTDGSLLVSEEGHLLRTMNAKDGYAVRHAIDRGYKVVIITGGTSLGVEKRLRGLGVSLVFIAVKDKLALYNDLVNKGDIIPEECVYVGDDVPDLDIMKAMPFTACPNDAVPEIIDVADYVSPFDGGKTCVRDIIQNTLKIQDNWL